jgi:adenosylhomocysteine nucleosidase
VVGLTAEARIASRFGGLVAAGGGTPAGAGAAAAGLAQQGARGLVSFGLAGGLDPALRPGAVIVATNVLSEGERLAADVTLSGRFGGVTGETVLAGTTVVIAAAAKAALFAATGAGAVDLESGAVARIALAYGLPFAVVRAVCDPAERDLPPAALIALDQGGTIGVGAVLRSVARQPGQIAGLLALARDAAAARRGLLRVARRFGEA